MEYIGNVRGGPCARRAHAALQSIGNEHLIFIYGGQSEKSLSLDDCWQFNANSSKWLKIRYNSVHIPVGRTMHSFVSYLPGKFLLYGGLARGNDGELDDCWTFDAIDGKWARVWPVGQAPGKRAGHTAVVGGNAMFLRGGQEKGDSTSVYRLNLHTWKWDRLTIAPGPAPVQRLSSSACWIPQFKCLLIAFGQIANIEDQVYCNDIWALAKGNCVADVWYWVKVELDSKKLVPRIESSMILLPGLKPRVLVWGGFMPETHKIAEDVVIIDLHEMTVNTQHRPEWPNRMLHSAFRVGAEFLVFGGVHMLPDSLEIVSAPNTMERFKIAFETLYGRKRTEDIRVRVERSDRKGALLSAVVDGKVYLSKVSHEMVRKAKSSMEDVSTANDKVEEIKDETVPDKVEVIEDGTVPDISIVEPAKIESLAVKRKSEKQSAKNGSSSACCNTPKRQRFGGNVVAKTCSASRSAIAPPKSQSPFGSQSAKRQSTIFFGNARAKGNPSPIAPPPQKQSQARTGAIAPPKQTQFGVGAIAPSNQASGRSAVITPPKQVQSRAGAIAPPKQLRAQTGAIAPPKQTAFRSMANTPTKQTQKQEPTPANAARKNSLPTDIGPGIGVEPPNKKSNGNGSGIEDRTQIAIAVADRSPFDKDGSYGTAGAPTKNAFLAGSQKEAMTKQGSHEIKAGKPKIGTPQRMGSGFAIAPPKVEVGAPTSKVDLARVSAIAMPKKSEEQQNVEMKEVMMAAEPVPDNISDLEDLEEDDELEPINLDPPSAAELAAATVGAHLGDRMEVEQQNESEQKETPKKTEVITID